MIKEISDYTKCVFENKFTLGGYVGIGSSAALWEVEPIFSVTVGIISFISLGASGLGIGTYRSYNVVNRYIEKYNTLKEGLIKRFSSDYCKYSGLRAAAKEHNLEHLVKSLD
ncbi:MAG: hypothetical protein PHV16_05045 [Candidatus Nanoarchaeia archaeon]|nr:hypothetical protein [Candidatus Nanoarchaeia archaeon]